MSLLDGVFDVHSENFVEAKVEYRLGVDLGTTFTGAAILTEGRAEVFSLGDHDLLVPSVVHLSRDDTMLVGEAAERASTTSPTRTAREFKRRLGDTTPIILGGKPFSAQALLAEVFRWVHARVTERHGEPPAEVALTFPANWGGYRRDVLAQAMRQAGVEAPVLLTEPEAAAVHYASTKELRPGEKVGVYDFGGGTFDAAILRRGAHGFETLGSPAGVEQLGGLDVDHAVFAHVAVVVGDDALVVDPADVAAVGALQQLRRECVLAKEALSYDSETAIAVNLPNAHAVIRLTRAELEDMVRPMIAETIVAFRRALESAGTAPGDLAAVLLAGGSSRMPLVAELLAADLGRPVAVDAHPKQVVALGAALRLTRVPQPVPAGAAGNAANAGSGGRAAPVGQPPPTVPGPRSAAPVPAAPVPAAPDSAAPVPSTTPRPPALAPEASPGPSAASRPGFGHRGRALLLAAGAAAVGTVLAAGTGLGATTPTQVLDADLAAPVALPAAVARPGDTLTFSVAGVPVTTARVDANGVLGPLRVSQHLVAGPCVVTGTRAAGDVVLRPRGGPGIGGLLSVPGVVAVAALMFAAAYAESWLRPLRRTGTTTKGTLLGMGVVGGIGGLAAGVLDWALRDGHLLTVPSLLAAGLGGVATMLLVTVAESRRAVDRRRA